MSTGKQRVTLLITAALLSIGLSGCRQDMQDAPYVEPFEHHEFWDNGSANRPLPAGTIARGLLKEDTRYWFGRDDGNQLINSLPERFDWTRDLLDRGQERYEIYCGVCHAATGSGRGMIVQRGFKQPQPLYEERLQGMPIGYFFDVITNGFGVMPHYRNQVPVDDRWAIAAYIRVLQVSQGSQLEELPPEVQESFRLAMSTMN
ncbi:MAG: cytochrome c, partial [Acidobacteriota bacterium]